MLKFSATPSNPVKTSIQRSVRQPVAEEKIRGTAQQNDGNAEKEHGQKCAQVAGPQLRALGFLLFRLAQAGKFVFMKGSVL